MLSAYMRCLAMIILISLAAPLSAQDWAVRDTDRALSRAEVETLTTGQTVTFYDDGQSKYSAGGAYSYTYASGEAAYGRYTISEDGTVCIQYRNGFSRCDRYVQSGERIVLLTENGLRFPIRPAEK